MTKPHTVTAEELRDYIAKQDFELAAAQIEGSVTNICLTDGSIVPSPNTQPGALRKRLLARLNGEFRVMMRYVGDTSVSYVVSLGTSLDDAVRDYNELG